MTERSLTQKLLVKEGCRMLILNAPEEFMTQLGALPENTSVDTQADGLYDWVQVFVKSKADIDTLALDAIAAIKPGSPLWIAYPKKTGKIKADISRDDGWETVLHAGWDGVTQISIDDTWSNLRFKPTAEIKNMTRKTRIGEK